MIEIHNSTFDNSSCYLIRFFTLKSFAVSCDIDLEAKTDLLTNILVGNMNGVFQERVIPRPRNLQNNICLLNEELRNMRDTISLMQEVYQCTTSPKFMTKLVLTNIATALS